MDEILVAQRRAEELRALVRQKSFELMELHAKLDAADREASRLWQADMLERMKPAK